MRECYYCEGCKSEFWIEYNPSIKGSLCPNGCPRHQQIFLGTNIIEISVRKKKFALDESNHKKYPNEEFNDQPSTDEDDEELDEEQNEEYSSYQERDMDRLLEMERELLEDIDRELIEELIDWTEPDSYER